MLNCKTNLSLCEIKKTDIKDDILSTKQEGRVTHSKHGETRTWQSITCNSIGTEVHPEDVPNSTTHIFHRPLPLNKTKQPYMQLTSIQLPGVQTNLSCLQPVSLLQPATAIKAINPSAEDDCDWFCRQTINLYLSHSLFWCEMYKISWKSVSCNSAARVK